jgi:hypothetical protein
MTPRAKWSLMLFLPAMALGIGCDSGSNSGGGQSMDAMVNAIESQKAAQQQAQQAEPPAQEVGTEEQPPAEPERRVAGRESVAPGGYYTAIVGARRHVLNKVESLAWIQGVQHFQATNGRLPKDHAEFMSQIVQPLGIDLGFKEENQEFLYDPGEGQWGTLYVVEKETQPAPQ